MKTRILLCLLFTIVIVHTKAQQWIHFTNTNSGLPYIWVNKIKIDQNNHKWMLDNNRNLVKFDDNSWTVYNYSNSNFPAQGGKAIAIDKTNNKWIATSVGLVKYDGNIFVKYDSSNSCLPTNNILDCDIDTIGNVWLATDLGIVNFDTSHNCTLYTSSLGNALGGIPNVKIDSRNWVWTLSNPFTGPFDISVFDGSGWKNYSSFSIGPHVAPYHLFCDSMGNVWGSAGDGILKFNGTSFSVPYDTSISGYFFTMGVVYANSTFIAATSMQRQSLNYYRNSTWTYYDRYNCPLDSLIFDFDCDKYGNLWIAGENGVYEFNPNGIVQSISKIEHPILNFYPNPTTGNFTISFNEPVQDGVVRVFNVLGEEVYSAAANKQGIASPAAQAGASFAMTINLGRVPAGIYFVQVTDFGYAQSSDRVKQWVQKVVVE